jgi:hypothetical protein
LGGSRFYFKIISICKKLQPFSDIPHFIGERDECEKYIFAFHARFPEVGREGKR